ncbi:hypothetical protein [Ancylobacter vacuolatus]|uniref:Uncharacterized protein n=1 Tax=Ancylobacter vacuolatus TaxID=223389 RepID=A0ABU0DFI5_9HYPH|nr:hypothetical protein [Ancylobacter vacuolatus]MDQ0347181.1 hypothetical protein [Ancylobacter vacuolatus]
MAREDRLVEDLRSIFDEARRSSGQVQAEALLAVAPVTLKSTESGVAYMRDRLTPESYREICRAIGDELDRLNNEIVRLKRLEKIAGVVETAQRRIVARPTVLTRPVVATAAKAAAATNSATARPTASATPPATASAGSVGPVKPAPLPGPAE